MNARGTNECTSTHSFYYSRTTRMDLLQVTEKGMWTIKCPICHSNIQRMAGGCLQSHACGGSLHTIQEGWWVIEKEELLYKEELSHPLTCSHVLQLICSSVLQLLHWWIWGSASIEKARGWAKLLWATLVSICYPLSPTHVGPIQHNEDLK